MTIAVSNTCPNCASDDVLLPADEPEWFCFTCEHRFLAEPIEDDSAE